MNEWESFADMAAPKLADECTVIKFILTLPPEGRLAVEAALADSVSIPGICGALRRIRPGRIPSEMSFYRHRSGLCCCKPVEL